MHEVSTKPYLIRAIHEWCVDQGYTPYLAVTVDKRTLVPQQFVKGGEIVLNVSPLATNNLVINNETIEFQARFGGVAQDLYVPISQVSGIYARENGHGLAFEVPKPLAIEPSEAPRPVGAKPAPLQSVDSIEESEAKVLGEGDCPEPTLSSEKESALSSKSASKDDGKGKKPRKSHLTRVK